MCVSVQCSSKRANLARGGCLKPEVARWWHTCNDFFISTQRVDRQHMATARNVTCLVVSYPPPSPRPALRPPYSLPGATLSGNIRNVCVLICIPDEPYIYGHSGMYQASPFPPPPLPPGLRSPYSLRIHQAEHERKIPGIM